MPKYILAFFTLGFIGFLLINYYFLSSKKVTITVPVINRNINSPTPAVTEIKLKKPPESKILPTDYHVFQTFNNCGPAAEGERQQILPGNAKG